MGEDKTIKGNQKDWERLWDTAQKLHIAGATRLEIEGEVNRAVRDVWNKLDRTLAEEE